MWANFYFFIQNFSGWHFSNREHYNKAWQDKLGVLLPQEKEQLKRFRDVRIKYPVSRSVFEQSFFLSDEPFHVLKDYLLEPDYSVVSDTFALFKNRFTELYRKELPILQQWRLALDARANNAQLIKEVSQPLVSLFGAPVTDNTISVYLLISSPGAMGGSATIAKDKISVEVSGCSIEEIERAIGIVWHETLHLPYLKKYAFAPLLDEVFTGNKKAKRVVEETTLALLFPNGVFGRRYLNRGGKRALSGITKEQEDELLEIISSYIKEDKQLDKEFIKKIYNTLFYASRWGVSADVVPVGEIIVVVPVGPVPPILLVNGRTLLLVIKIVWWTLRSSVCCTFDCNLANHFHLLSWVFNLFSTFSSR